jgi:hypothetical protein
MGIGRETLRSAMKERRIRSEDVITVGYHFQSYLSLYSPDIIMCIHRGCTKRVWRPVSAHAGAIERPFGCGSDGISIDRDLAPYQAVHVHHRVTVCIIAAAARARRVAASLQLSGIKGAQN